ncbi:serine protease [Crucibulum laeve]|uniref:Serine protease n=1 Tax=Crucibulum laeve TaxID=68775 RepID=A0A5C3M6Z4_9AGAR|nr:serine protease [Crucibulum laeve]
MHFFSVAFATLALVAAPVLAAPSPLKSVEKFRGETNGKYIVKLKSGISRKGWINKLQLNSTVDWALLNGFAGSLSEDALNTLRASDDVEYIQEDGIMHTMVTQTNAPWGLQRVSQDAKLTSTDTSALTYIYTYDASAGAGVDIYVVDTGIYTSHSDFGGRARWGASFGGYGTSDGNGHGTHCAGTAAGTQYGVAKKANVIAVKVLSDSGSGATSTIVSGLNWVLTQAEASGRPSVVSMSLGGSASTALDNAVTSLTSAGVHVAVAAGNSNVDAANTSPARAASAITGAVVDIFAPGANVISTWIGSTTAINNISGTSMATPHIAGLIAYLISKDGNVTPAAMSTKIKNLSVKSILTGIPSGTVNYLANNA